MKPKDFIIQFLITFGVTLIVNIVVTACWNYFIKGTGLFIDWETSFQMAIVFAVVIPFIQKKK